MSYKPLATAIYIEHQLLEGSLRLAATALRQMRDGETVEVENVLAQLESDRAAVREFTDIRYAANCSGIATLSGTATSGTVFLYWDSAGNLTADESIGTELTCNSNCRIAATGGFPTGSLPIAQVNYGNNSFIGCTTTDFRSYSSNKTVYCGTGLICSVNASTGELTVSSDTVNTLLTKATFQAGTATYCASSAGSSSHTCSLTPTMTSYTVGTVVQFTLMSTAVSGPATLAIDGLAAKPIKQANGISDPASGSIAINQQVPIWYDGSAWRLPAAAGLTQIGSTVVAQLPSCNSSVLGLTKTVSDAAAPTIGGNVAGGGFNAAQVWCNGINWRVTGI